MFELICRQHTLFDDFISSTRQCNTLQRPLTGVKPARLTVDNLLNPKIFLIFHYAHLQLEYQFRKNNL